MGRWSPHPGNPPKHRPPPGGRRFRDLLKQLYFWVLIAVVAGAVFGSLAPEIAQGFKPAGDLFIRLVSMIITPIVFCTVVLGIGTASDLRKVGRVGVKALLYFQVATALALLIGLVVANLVRPGAGMNVDPATLSDEPVEAADAAPHGIAEFLTGIVPESVVGAFAEGEILQVLFFSILFGIAVAMLGDTAGPIHSLLETLQQALFKVLGLIMYFAPIGAFGAVAYTAGEYGAHTLGHLATLMVCFYLTCGVFVFGALAGVIRLCGIPFFRLLRYFRRELLVVLATTSTETVLPQTMNKLHNLGCGRSVVNLTVPTGYSFNLDGAAIYLTMASLFIGQALNIDLSLGEQVLLLVVLVVSSKGGAGVSGAALAVLATTLSAVKTIPVAGIALILGIDRFMNEARALTNLIGNVTATIVVSRWEKDLDLAQAKRVLRAEH